MISKQMKNLFIKEFLSYFKGPLGYVFLTIFLFGIGHLTFEPGRGSFFYMREASMHSFFKYIPWMFLFLIPAVSMRLWSEERKSGSIELLLTLPVTVSQAVLAKFIASWAFIGVALALTFPMVVTVIYLGAPDIGVIAMGYIASFLLAGAMLAVGIFFSALTKNQVISFILSAVSCLALLMAGSPPVLDFISRLLPKYVVELVESMSALNQFEALERGVLGLDSVWFFGVIIVMWIVASIVLINENKAN